MIDHQDPYVIGFRSGYTEYRWLALSYLRELAALPSGHKEAINDLIVRMKIEEDEEVWQSVQEEFPGMTREQYEAELEQSFNMIKAKHYDVNGKRKQISVVKE